MQKRRVRWGIASPHKPGSPKEVLEILLAARGFDSAWLSAGLECLEDDARTIRNLDLAALTVADHLLKRDKIVLAGDYDCDGLTSIAQVALFLKRLGIRDFVAATPANRAEGYGMPLEPVQANPDARLFLVFDCGSFDVEAVAAARRQGADVVVIDHHAIDDPSRLAPATVLVNPRHPECPSRFKDFATAGLVLLFLSRLRRALEPKLGRALLIDGDYVALAAVGTVADMMPLVAGNRALVRHGLEMLTRGRFLPLQALRAVAGLGGRPLKASHIGFQIAPRLNAAGRVGDAQTALSLLLADDPGEIEALARALDLLNRQRQQQVEEISVAMLGQVAALPERSSVVLADESYPLGINGILAQHVVREVGRPAVVLQILPEEGVATGSARSVPGVNLHAALCRCADLLDRWGGHAMAAGLSVPLERLEIFRERFESVVRESETEAHGGAEWADMELEPALVTPELLEALERLEPHGVGNPTPRFALRGQKITGVRTFGRGPRGPHLEIGLPAGLSAVRWQGGGACAWKAGDQLDLVCTFGWNDYQGCPQAIVQDFGPELFDRALALESAGGTGIPQG